MSTKTLLEVVNQADSHSGNMRGVLNLLIFFFSEVKGDERPKDAELFGLFSFLNAEAKAIAEGLESCPGDVLPGLAWDAAYSTLAITNTLESCFQVVDLEIPLGDLNMDNLLTAIMSSLDRMEQAMRSVDLQQKGPATTRAKPLAAHVATQVRARRAAIKTLEAA